MSKPTKKERLGAAVALALGTGLIVALMLADTFRPSPDKFRMGDQVVVTSGFYLGCHGQIFYRHYPKDVYEGQFQCTIADGRTGRAEMAIPGEYLEKAKLAE